MVSLKTIYNLSFDDPRAMWYHFLFCFFNYRGSGRKRKAPPQGKQHSPTLLLPGGIYDVRIECARARALNHIHTT